MLEHPEFGQLVREPVEGDVGGQDAEQTLALRGRLHHGL